MSANHTPMIRTLLMMLCLMLGATDGRAADPLTAVREQAGIQINIQTPLGINPFDVDKAQTTEELYGNYHFLLEVSGITPDIAPEDFLGREVAMEIKRGERVLRYFNGMVSRFSAGDEDADGRRHYTLELVSQLWFLGLGRNSRIFQEMTVPDVLGRAMREAGVSNFRFDLQGAYPVRECLTQYNESDFDFVSRLMEQEGIHFYHIHSRTGHTIVFADSNAGPGPATDIPYIGPPARGPAPVSEGITHWEMTHTVLPGIYTINDHNFKMPDADLLASAQMDRGHAQDKYEYYQYPGLHVEAADGERLARVGLEAFQARYQTVNAALNRAAPAPGALFNLTGHPRSHFNGKYYVTGARHVIEPNPHKGHDKELIFRSELTAIPAAHTFRPLRRTPVPVIHGPLPAIVTGPTGEEIYTDEHGRIKVKFYWDRSDATDDTSSCWIRVAQPHTSGSTAIPEVGDEVLVAFEGGDINRPIVIGRLFNGTDTPPRGEE